MNQTTRQLVTATVWTRQAMALSIPIRRRHQDRLCRFPHHVPPHLLPIHHSDTIPHLVSQGLRVASRQ
jgi:hypothetical protein